MKANFENQDIAFQFQGLKPGAFKLWATACPKCKAPLRRRVFQHPRGRHPGGVPHHCVHPGGHGGVSEKNEKKGRGRSATCALHTLAPPTQVRRRRLPRRSAVALLPCDASCCALWMLATLPPRDADAKWVGMSGRREPFGFLSVVLARARGGVTATRKKADGGGTRRGR